MSGEKGKSLTMRGFTSVLITISFAILAITGVILFFVPPGRIANWTNWKFMALTKGQWQGLHIWFGVVFLTMSAVHIWLNWKTLLAYFKKRIGEASKKRQFAFKWDWALPLVLCIGVGVGTLAGVPPFSSLIEFGENFKERYESNDRQAPVAHAELLTLKELTSGSGVEFEQMKNRLSAEGIEVNSDADVVGDLAKTAGISPEKLYQIAVGKPESSRGNGQGAGQGGGQGGGKGEEHSSGGYGQGGGPGRKTLEQFCSAEGLSLEDSIERLQGAGYEATAQSMLRDIAENNNAKPYEIIELLTAE